MLLFVYNRSRQHFGNALETFILLRLKKQIKASAFVTIFYVQTFIHVLVVLTVFLFTAFLVSCCISSPEISGNVAAIFSSKNVTVFIVVMVTLLYHTSFAVIPLLRRNSYALNQSHLRNFSAYIL